MQKILFVSHCILNTAAKVVRYGDTGKKEEESRLEFVVKTVEQGIQLVQLPCPEFTLYGPGRWGHTKEQFDNPFFRAPAASACFCASSFFVSEGWAADEGAALPPPQPLKASAASETAVAIASNFFPVFFILNPPT